MKVDGLRTKVSIQKMIRRKSKSSAQCTFHGCPLTPFETQTCSALCLFVSSKTPEYCTEMIFLVGDGQENFVRSTRDFILRRWYGDTSSTTNSEYSVAPNFFNFLNNLFYNPKVDFLLQESAGPRKLFWFLWIIIL